MGQTLPQKYTHARGRRRDDDDDVIDRLYFQRSVFSHTQHILQLHSVDDITGYFTRTSLSKLQSKLFSVIIFRLHGRKKYRGSTPIRKAKDCEKLPKLFIFL